MQTSQTIGVRNAGYTIGIAYRAASATSCKGRLLKKVGETPPAKHRGTTIPARLASGRLASLDREGVERLLSDMNG